MLALHVQGAEWVEWSFGPHASPVLARLLSQGGFPEVTVTGVSSAPFTFTDCVARVLRPASSEVGTHDSENRITCHVVQGKTTGTVQLSLAGEAVESWGSFGSPRAFQIRGSLVARLGRLIQRAQEAEPENRVFEHMDFAGPEGHRILSYGLMRVPDQRLPGGGVEYGTLALSCNFYLQNEALHSSFCSFLVFD